MDEFHVWESLLDGDSFEKKFYAIRLAALWRVNNFLIVATVVQDLIIVGLRAAEDLRKYAEKASDVETASILMSAAPPMVILCGMIRVMGYLHCHQTLIIACLSKTIFDIPVASGDNKRFEVSRWRNPEHKDLFYIARYLERCIPRLENRYTAMQHEEISKTYFALALELRNEATKADRETVRIGALALGATTISLNDDLTATCRRLQWFLALTPDKTERVGSSRIGRFLASIDGALARNSRILIALGVAIVVVYYLYTGQVEKIMEIIQAG